jgi:hypothetical protein
MLGMDGMAKAELVKSVALQPTFVIWIGQNLLWRLANWNHVITQVLFDRTQFASTSFYIC